MLLAVKEFVPRERERRKKGLLISRMKDGRWFTGNANPETGFWGLKTAHAFCPDMVNISERAIAGAPKMCALLSLLLCPMQLSSGLNYSPRVEITNGLFVESSSSNTHSHLSPFPTERRRKNEMHNIARSSETASPSLLDRKVATHYSPSLLPSFFFSRSREEKRRALASTEVITQLIVM